MKILIIYASGYGSTGEVARKIGQSLAADGVDITVSSLPMLGEMKAYDAVVIGSAIRYDRWMWPVQRFVRRYKDHLSKIPVAGFFCCLTLARRTPETEKKAGDYAEQFFSLSESVKPINVGGFGGVLNYSKMPIWLRFFFKFFGLIVGLPEGDYRDWDEIQQWAGGLRKELKIGQ